MRTLLIAAVLATASSAMALVQPPTTVPDTGATGLMLVAALGGIAAARRFFRR